MNKYSFIALLLISFSLHGITNAQNVKLHLRFVDQNGDSVKQVRVRFQTESGSWNVVNSGNSSSVTIENLNYEKISLEVHAVGFKTVSRTLTVAKIDINVVVKLELIGIEEEVEIETDTQDSAVDPRSGAFTNFLTRQQLDALPDDPVEIRRELERQFGQDVFITVDGFTGGRIPPKSQIAAIKVTRTAFDAEYHQIGNTVIDIISKAGGGWSGSFSLNYNNAFLNARPAFAIEKLPSQISGFDGFINGPIFKNRTTFFLNVYGKNSYSQENIVAALPNGEYRNSQKATENSFGSWLKISHNLNKTDVLNISYSNFFERTNGLGVGGFDLPSRAFEKRTDSHQFQGSASQYIGKRFLNEFRFQYTYEKKETNPKERNPAIIVLDSFNAGSATNNSSSSRHSLWISDNLLFGIGNNHAVKIGGLLEIENLKSTFADNSNGTFIFSNLEDYSANRPASYSESPGFRSVEISQVRIGVFIQDDVRLHKSLIASIGIRYESQNSVKDRNNFSPRVGFTWSPFKSGSLTFRGGAGFYYGWVMPSDLAYSNSQNFDEPGEILVADPGYPNPFSGGQTLVLPKSFRVIDSGLRNPYTFVTSIGIERRFKKKWFLRSFYEYQKGIRQFRSRDINAPTPNLFERPNPQFGKITQLESTAYFVRNKLDFEFTGPIGSKLFIVSGYTLGKVVSDSIGFYAMPSNSYNLRLDRAPADFDQRHRIYTSANWKIRKNLRLSGIFSSNSGFPYNITTGQDNNQDTVFNDRPAGTDRNTLRGTWSRQFDGSISWTKGFAKREKDGSSLPGTLVISESEAKSGDFGIDSRYKYSLKFRVTATNVFNHTNLRNFVGVKTSPFFQQATGSANPRQIEFGVRFSF